MARTTGNSRAKKSTEKVVDDNTGDRTTAHQPAAKGRKSSTPIETYKGDPDAERSNDIGDIEEETLDSHAPFNKTYGIENGPDR